MGERRVAVITGAANGIGRATALELGRAGYALAICDLDAAELERTAVAAGAELARVVDVSQAAQIAQLVEACRERFGRVDVLVNNAGVLRLGAWQDVSEADWRQTFDVNLLGVTLVTRAFLASARRSARSRRQPRLRCLAAPLPRVRDLRTRQGRSAMASPSTCARSLDRAESRCRASARCSFAPGWAPPGRPAPRANPTGCSTRRSTSPGWSAGRSGAGASWSTAHCSCTHCISSIAGVRASCAPFSRPQPEASCERVQRHRPSARPEPVRVFEAEAARHLTPRRPVGLPTVYFWQRGQ